jgi:hypothetical protein
MKVFNITLTQDAGWLYRTSWLMLFAALAIGLGAPARARAAPPTGAPSEANMTAFLMQWFTEMQSGRTKRSLYAPAYAAQVSDDAVSTMSRDLNKYGASPLRAEIVQTRKNGGQNFYIVKFVFPRGDATTLLFGFDAAGKITGIAIGGLAGD